MPDDDTYLAWSRSIEGVKFRAFAFTSGCDDPDCDVCPHLSEEHPISVVFMSPRPGDGENDHDEWCFCMSTLGDVFAPDAKPLEDIIVACQLLDDKEQRFWRKCAALFGLPWSRVTATPYHAALRQMSALDEVRGDEGTGIVKAIMDQATPAELRQVRDSHRHGSGFTFGQSFAELWWRLIRRQAKRGR